MICFSASQGAFHRSVVGFLDLKKNHATYFAPTMIFDILPWISPSMVFTNGLCLFMG